VRARSVVGYLFVSGVCFLLSNVILIAADEVRCPLIISVLLSYAVVVVAGYLLHSMISFQGPFGAATFWRYALAMAANVPMTFGTVYLWRDIVGLPMSYSAPIATCCMFLVNFVLCRWMVFHDWKGMGIIGCFLQGIGRPSSPRVGEAIRDCRRQIISTANH
jgi:putative flippase GtrA